MPESTWQGLDRDDYEKKTKELAAVVETSGIGLQVSGVALDAAGLAIFAWDIFCAGISLTVLTIALEVAAADAETLGAAEAAGNELIEALLGVVEAAELIYVGILGLPGAVLQGLAVGGAVGQALVTGDTTSLANLTQAEVDSIPEVLQASASYVTDGAKTRAIREGTRYEKPDESEPGSGHGGENHGSSGSNEGENSPEPPSGED
ncbi:hypothetical protein [Fodinicola feengrottensis]|uniref:hypothetical protein n=1 Tax=Fodinicola feengrottensis TaxID=435914 RepID=UPI002441FC27|nr:hypothetical protein [Fodinicola feengrottensis]